MDNSRRNICILTADAGQGHRMTASALKTVMEERYPWNVRIVNPYQDVLGDLDEFHKRFGIRGEDVYNKWILRRGNHALYPVFFHLCNINMRMNWQRGLKMLRAFWPQVKPDLVLSVIPFMINGALLTSLHEVFPDVPYVSLMTDLQECKPGFWLVHPDQYFIVGTAAAAERTRAIGHRAERLFQVSGMVIDPSFYVPEILDRHAARAALGLAADTSTALVMMGGHGSRTMVKIAEILDRTALNLQAIFLCGHARSAAEAIRKMPTRYPKAVVDFTSEVGHYMSLADFFIGKPGPGSITEALVKKLPLLIHCNRFMLPTERPNGPWVERQGFGISFQYLRRLPGALQRLLEPGAFAAYKKNVEDFRSQALFEVPEIVNRILTDQAP